MPHRTSFKPTKVEMIYTTFDTVKSWICANFTSKEYVKFSTVKLLYKLEKSIHEDSKT